MTEPTSETTTKPSTATLSTHNTHWGRWAVAGAALVTLLWAFWTTLAEAAQRWGHDPQYSHGYLVPIFAAALLWLRRERLHGADLTPTWWGLAILLAGVTLRLAGVHFYFVWLDPIALLPCLAGVVLLLGGWSAWRWAWPAVGFLFFMIPLPYRVEVSMAGPLQRIATISSTFLLQTIGLPAIAEGNVILLNDVELGIVEACSGLRMLVIFFALSTAVALLTNRRLGDRLIIVASAIPIALVTNVLRITVTGILHDTVGSDIANAVFHDLAGWLMMPVALGFLALELKLLSALLIEPEPEPEPTPRPMSRRPVPPRSTRRQRRQRSEPAPATV
jgi:exosortase